MGQTVFITGGTRGIGRALVEGFAVKGYTVIYTYEKSKEIAEELDCKYENVHGFRCDINNYSDCEALARETLKKFGGIDILINNVGITRDKSFSKMTYEQWTEVISVNLIGLYNFTHAFYPGMCERGWGRIVNIASIIGQTGAFGQTNYAASKAGVIGFTKALALECAEKGVTVNAIAPGFIDTSMTRQIPEDILEGIRYSIPQKKLGKTDDVVNTVLHLVSDNSSYITGQALGVNGGMY